VLMYYEMTTFRMLIPHVEILEVFSCYARELGRCLSCSPIQMMREVRQMILYMSFASFYGG
jgi:hypothetical protein